MAKGILTDDNDIEDDDIQLFHKIMVVETILTFFQQFNISTFTYFKKKFFLNILILVFAQKTCIPTYKFWGISILDRSILNQCRDYNLVHDHKHTLILKKFLS